MIGLYRYLLNFLFRFEFTQNSIVYNLASRILVGEPLSGMYTVVTLALFYTLLMYADAIHSKMLVKFQVFL